MALAITPPASPYRFGDPGVPAPEFTATGQTGLVTWSVSEGFMAPATGDSSILSPLNKTRTLTVTAHDDGSGQTAIVTFKIEATLPIEADWGVESDINPGFELSIPEKGPPRFRQLSRTAQWPLIFKIRRFQDYAGVRDFLIANETFPFWIEDSQLGELRKVYQDSALRRIGRRINWMEYSVQVRDYQYNPPTNVADWGPFASGDPPPLYDEPDYGD